MEAIWMRLLELLAVGGVLDVGIKGDDARVAASKAGQCGAVGLTRGHTVTDLVRGLSDRAPHRSMTRDQARRLWRRRWFVLGHELRFELRKCPIELVALQRLTVPAVLALDERNPFSLERL